MARSNKPPRKGKGTSFGKKSEAERSFIKRGKKSSETGRFTSRPSGSTDSPRSFRPAPPSFGKPAGKSFSKSFRHRDRDTTKDIPSGDDKPDARPAGRQRNAGVGSYKPPFRKTSDSARDTRKDAPPRDYRPDARRQRDAGAGSYKPPFKKTSGSARDTRKDTPSRDYRPDARRQRDAGAGPYKPPFKKTSGSGWVAKYPGKSKNGGGDHPQKKYPAPEGRGNFKRPFTRAAGPPTPRENERPSGDREKKPFQKPERKSFIESRIVRSGDFTKTISTPPTNDAKDDGLIRLNKYIANSGVGSRREADKLIEMGLISVNGTTITELGTKVKRTDVVRYEDRLLKVEKNVYILLNKPKGFITTTEDPQERNTVMGLVAAACKERVYPVGRLDRNTTGLLLITNDGDLADRLTHPSYKAKKVYKAELDKPLSKTDAQHILKGVTLEEGRALVDDLAIISDDGKTVGLEIHIGWNRVVRRIFESLGYTVVKLDRSVYAGLDKKDLSRGQWRFLKPEEVIRLKHFQ